MVKIDVNGVVVMVGNRSVVSITDERGKVYVMEGRGLGATLRREAARRHRALRVREPEVAVPGEVADERLMILSETPEGGVLKEHIRPGHVMGPLEHPGKCLDTTACGHHSNGYCAMDLALCEGLCGEHAARAIRQKDAAESRVVPSKPEEGGEGK